MPLKFIYKRKRENWGREADRELKRRDKAVEKATATETRKREVLKMEQRNKKKANTP